MKIPLRVLATVVLAGASIAILPSRCADASEGPAGLAGRAQTAALLPWESDQYFEWYEYFGVHQVEPGDVVELSFAIIPFADDGWSGTTVGIDTESGATFFTLTFAKGLVNKLLSYHPNGWNTVKVVLDGGNQVWGLAVNNGEPVVFPFGATPYSMQALRVNYDGPGPEPVVAWLDSVSISLNGSKLLDVDFDRTLPNPDSHEPACRLDAVQSPNPFPNTPPPSSGPLSIISPPVSQIVSAGTRARFDVQAAGVQPLEYQWEFNGMPIEGAHDASLVIASVTPELQGYYAVSVVDASGATVRSSGAALSILQSGGCVFFSNRVLPGIDAPVFDSDRVTRLAGEEYYAQLYAGPEPTTLAPVGLPVPFRTGAGAGYWLPGPDAVRNIPTVPPGNVAFVQVRAWKVGYGTTFEQTQAHGGPLGASEVLRIITGGAGAPPSLPPNLDGLRSFALSSEVDIGADPALNKVGAKASLAFKTVDHTISLRMAGQPGETYYVERSSDLIHWEAAGRVAQTDADAVFRCHEFSPSQFYRVFVLPRGSQ